MGNKLYEGVCSKGYDHIVAGMRGYDRFDLEQGAQELAVKAYLGIFVRYDQASDNRMVQGMIDAASRKGWRGMNLDPVYTVSDEKVNKQLYFTFQLLARISLVPSEESALRAAHMQDMVVQARLAIALERYYLAKGEYPKTLEELVPSYLAVLPEDVLTGKPMHYQRPEPAEFRLWADGWDGVDEGGKAGAHQLEEGDWVWGRP